jgi:hypothetical protein
MKFSNRLEQSPRSFALADMKRSETERLLG